MSDLPKEYDVIIAGTGLTESIVSAALSRIGKTVLQIDRECFYGGEFSSHALASLTEWTDKITKAPIRDESKSAEKSINLLECNNDPMTYYSHFKYQWNEKDCPEDIKENLLKLSRRFSIDLCPNIFYARGQFIELLISSDVSKYCEFRLITQILTLNKDGKLEKVPTSRSEVFKTDKLSMIEKRHMMKFIQACMKDNDFQDLIEDSNSKMSFSEFVREKKLSESITNFIINAVAMAPNEDQSVADGLKEMKKFLSSVGRFGDSPFLYSLYGTGELPQCFCRMAAVFGAIYHLNMTIKSFQTNSDTNLIEKVNVLTGDVGTEFSCKNLIIDSSYVPLEYFNFEKPAKKISRCILITDRSIFDNSEENISLLFLPKTSEKVPNIHCIEASYVSQCSPKGYYLVYLFCDQLNINSPEADFSEFINMFFKEKQFTQASDIPKQDEAILETTRNLKIGAIKPKIIFEYFYSHVDSHSRIDASIIKESIPANLFITTSSQAKLDFDDHVSQAKEIFKRICPDEEFLPKPPEQEDIIFDYETKESEEVNAENLDDKKESVENDKVDKEVKTDGIKESKEEATTSQESPTFKEPNGKKSKILTDNSTEDKAIDET